MGSEANSQRSGLLYVLSKVKSSISQDGEFEFSIQPTVSRLGTGSGGTVLIVIGDNKDARMIPPVLPHITAGGGVSSGEQIGINVNFPVALKVMLLILLF